MSRARTFTRSFSGGEVTPEFWGQIADAKFQTGLAKCRNFKVMPHGPVQNRSGTRFVREAASNAGNGVNLIPFEFSASQTLVLEAGNTYLRFHTMGATVETTPGTPYQVTTPYSAADVFGLHYVQSADVLTLVHPSHPPKELRRTGPTSWPLVDIVFTPALSAPGTVTGTASPAPGGLSSPKTYVYKVTAVTEDGDESYVSTTSISLTNNLLQTDAYNDVAWGAVTGASRYRVYLRSNGLFGYIGETDGLTFRDDNITPDLSKTPPQADTPFTGAGNYPAAVSYYDQRRVFAGTTNKPQNVWMTRTGTESNLNYSVPTRDDDRVAFRIAARQVNAIRHLVPLSALMALTGSTEWRITSTDGGSITPSSKDAKAQSHIGANNVQPAMVGNNILFAAARGGHMHELAYSYNANGFVTGDLSLRAPHLFNNKDIVGMAYAKAPYPVLWAVSSNGKLLGLTYVPEQQIGAWHQHDTAGGLVKSVCVVAEGAEDAVYLCVQRTINGTTRNYIERMVRDFDGDTQAPNEAVFLDCSLTYDGAPTSTITGLAHLEGCTVGVLADGAEMPQRVVQGGQITLDVPASVVTVGLPIEADLQTLPLVLESVGAFGQGRVKNVNKAVLRVKSSSGLSVGPAFNSLVPDKSRTIEPLGSPAALVTDEVEIVIEPSWSSGGQVCVRQSSPLPLTITSMTIEAAVGG